MSDELIELDKFIEFFQVDPHYFETTFLLLPNNSEKPYASPGKSWRRAAWQP